jgi:hypothetical protein
VLFVVKFYGLSVENTDLMNLHPEWKKMLLKIIGGLFIVFGLMSGKLTSTILMVGFGGALLYFSTVKSKLDDGAKAFMKLPFVEKADFKHAFVNSAIAISKSERKVLMANEKLVKEYPFDAIKSWKYESNPALSVADKIQHGMSFGFFVTVKDIDHPVWRIAFNQNDPKSTFEMQRWMEIFDQFVNETTVTT